MIECAHVFLVSGTGPLLSIGKWRQAQNDTHTMKILCYWSVGTFSLHSLRMCVSIQNSLHSQLRLFGIASPCTTRCMSNLDKWHNTTQQRTIQHNTIQHNTSHSSAFTCKCNCNFVLRALALAGRNQSIFKFRKSGCGNNDRNKCSGSTTNLRSYDSDMYQIISTSNMTFLSFQSQNFTTQGIFFSPPCGLPVWPYSWTQFRPASAICVIFSFQEGRKCCIFGHKNAAFSEQTTKRNVIRTIWITMMWYSPYSLDVWLLLFFP